MVYVLAVAVVILSGAVYRVLASRLELLAEKPLNLPIPLSAFPSQIGKWVGGDISIPSTTKEYMKKNFADDFLSRRYINASTGAWADVYVVYCSSRPGA